MDSYRVPHGVLVQEVLSETVLLDTERGLFFELNSMGTEIFRMLTNGDKPQDIVQQLLPTYEVDEIELGHDINTLITELQDKGLLLVETC